MPSAQTELDEWLWRAGLHATCARIPISNFSLCFVPWSVVIYLLARRARTMLSEFHARALRSTCQGHRTTDAAQRPLLLRFGLLCYEELPRGLLWRRSLMLA